MKQLQILMIEDSIPDAQLVDNELRKAGFNFQFQRVDTETEFQNALHEKSPDIILSDHGLPGFDGMAALKMARERCPETPFIFVTGSRFVPPAETSVVADDYILKTELGALAPSIERALEFSEQAEKTKTIPVRMEDSEIERRVAKRTAELEAVNKELEHFSQSIALELRAPLRHIDSLVETLNKSAAAKLDEKSRGHLQTIGQSAHKITKLVDELIAFSRISHTEIYKLPFSSADLVKESIHDLRGETEGRKIEWAIGELPEIHGDPVMLWLVWVNLISNAIKFTREKSDARIEIGCVSSEFILKFFIRDNGIGFEQERAKDLFQVFQRLHPARDFEGIGVGLANVRRIIQRHGGRVWAKGKVNEGATFYFTLPRL